MVQNPTITLSIKEAGERPNSTYLFHIQLDEKIFTSNQSLSLPDSQTLREISRSFGSLFEQGCRPEMDTDAQRALGKQLFDLWLAESWEKITASIPVGALRFFVVASDIPEILNLLWELLFPPEGDFLGINPLFRIRRFPFTSKQMATFTGELRPGPLRLLFMACSPTNLVTLDYETRGGGIIPRHLRSGCGLRFLRPGQLRGTQGEGERIQAPYSPPDWS